MKNKNYIGSAIAGACAGAVNGVFGAGGGMILVPLLTWLTPLQDEEVFPASVCIILPICFVSLAIHSRGVSLPLQEAWPYLLGSTAGGILAGILGKRIPTHWLHKILGVLILWGGVRYLC